MGEVNMDYENNNNQKVTDKELKEVRLFCYFY